MPTFFSLRDMVQLPQENLPTLIYRLHIFVHSCMCLVYVCVHVCCLSQLWLEHNFVVTKFQDQFLVVTNFCWFLEQETDCVAVIYPCSCIKVIGVDSG